MNKVLKMGLTVLGVAALAVLVIFVGGRDSTPIVSGIIDSKEYSDFEKLEEAKQISEIPLSGDIYATFHFIESPAGQKYSVRWSLDGKEIQNEIITIEKGTEGVFSSKLTAGDLKSGKIKVQVFYEKHDKVLFSAESDMK